MFQLSQTNTEVNKGWGEGGTTESGHKEPRIYGPQGHFAELL